MRVGMSLTYSGGFLEAVDDLVEYEAAGLQILFVPEAYTFDAVSQLGYAAAHTRTVEIASGILPIYTRTPTLTAMTAAGLDYVSGGRFTLGLGASGPQVIEGFHGVAYDDPLGRTREVVDICRQVWQREKVSHVGRHYQVPMLPDLGTGLGKPLRLINHPVREQIPIMLAAIGPKNVALAAEIAEGWQPMFYRPEQADTVWGDALAAGAAARSPTLPPLDIVAGAQLAIGDDVDGLMDIPRHQLALYLGGMGARGRNFYHDLAVRYGYEGQAGLVQDLYLSGRKAEAAAAVPASLVAETNLIGPREHIAERIAAYAASGVTTLNLTPIARHPAQRVRDIALVREIAEGM
ncbi:LLM class F420-dependent oxidoreductase [Actinophytocola oryzae]|uniref:F420-dependent oxidoreductase-like protein n=1 Tax=Actinophytocola oryzae TaxID=502181 RepID=A0A4R7UWX8_9PSEU|nr:LLM class F420-dependent oxidoreductase [Actinophytocola oryzae]TDV41313.1 F420-dependent oxidoreductase-like protein [Actinophytocola oryzae]